MFEDPLDAVAAVGSGAPTLVVRAMQADGTDVVPGAVGVELYGAVNLHLHEILSK
jgi:hypothetical protein